MAKTSQMQIRLDDELKSDAENVLSQLGLSATEYVRMSLRQLVMRKGIPFDARVFNEETVLAISESRAAHEDGSIMRFDSSDDAMNYLMSDDDFEDDSQ